MIINKTHTTIEGIDYEIMVTTRNGGFLAAAIRGGVTRASVSVSEETAQALIDEGKIPVQEVTRTLTNDLARQLKDIRRENELLDSRWQKLDDRGRTEERNSMSEEFKNVQASYKQITGDDLPA